MSNILLDVREKFPQALLLVYHPCVIEPCVGVGWGAVELSHPYFLAEYRN